MIFECVNFNEEAVAKMAKKEFVSRHISILWQNRDEATRKKMLNQVYDLITKPDEQTEEETE